MDKEQPKKILIILLGALGDVTRALSLAVRIKRYMPNVELSWAIEPKSEGMVENHPDIDRIFVFDRPKGLSAYRSFVKELQQEKFDIVLDLQRHFKSGVTSYLTKAQRRIGFHKKNAKEFNWLFNTETIDKVENFSAKIEHYQKFGDVLEIPRMEKLEFSISPTEEELKKIKSIIGNDEGDKTKNKVALVLGSTWESRFWFVEHYVNLIKILNERYNMKVLLIGAQSERSFAEEIMVKLEPGMFTNLVGKTSLKELKAVFSSVKLVIGSDSGPMHIAAALGVRVISLWGSTSPKRSAPYGSEDLVLESHVSCSPCYLRVCPGLGRRCMFEIGPQAVLAKVDYLVQLKEGNTQ